VTSDGASRPSGAMRPKACGRRLETLARRAGLSAQFDRRQKPHLAVRHTASKSKEVAMPIDSIVVSVAVVSVFLIFAGVLIWGDFQSGRMRQQPVSRNRKRRSF
jgi:hypothetical protein